MSTLNEVLQNVNSTGFLVCQSERQAIGFRAQRIRLLERSCRAWTENLQIMSLDKFFRSRWLATFPEKEILHPIQSLALAKRLVDECDLLPTAQISSMSIARGALQAFNLSQTLNCSLDDVLWADCAEHTFFKSFYHRFNEMLSKRGLILPAMLASDMAKSGKEQRMNLTSKVFLAPGIELTPSCEQFLDNCVETDRVERIDSKPTDRRAEYGSVVSSATEYAEVARWTRRVIDEAEEGEDICVHVVVSDLALARPPLQLAFENAFEFTRRLDSQCTLCPWEFSRGDPVSNNPHLASAVDLLLLLTDRWPLETLLRVVQFRAKIANNEDEIALYRFDAWVREQGIVEIERHQWEHLIAGFSYRASLSWLDEAMQTSHEFDRQLDRTPSQWCTFFDDHLTSIGWISWLTSYDGGFRMYGVWKDTLEDLKRLDNCLGPIGLHRCLAWLREIVDTKHYSSVDEHASPIKVIEENEYVPGVASHVWIVGADASRFPQSPKQHPFLPKDLLVRYGYSLCFPDGAMQASIGWLDKVVNDDSKECIFSYASMTDRGAQKPAALVSARTSELIIEVDETSVDPTVDLKLVEEMAIPAINVNDLKDVKNAISVVKTHLESPFISFVKYRLGAKPLAIPTSGMSAMLQGELVHECLKLFWQRCKKSSEIAGLNTESLRKKLNEIAGGILARAYKKRLQLHGKKIAQLEIDRVIELCAEWLWFESKRETPFEVVATEKAVKFDLFGLAFSVRVDRIDSVTTESGTHNIVIDYKTGMFDAKSVLPDSLKEPQLPIYYLGLENQGTHGFAIANVASTRFKYHVHASNTNLGFGAQARGGATEQSWTENCVAWRETIGNAVDDFVAGNAKYNPTQQLARHFELFRPLVRARAQRNGRQR